MKKSILLLTLNNKSHSTGKGHSSPNHKRTASSIHLTGLQIACNLIDSLQNN